jgi:hypothetical protein
MKGALGTKASEGKHPHSGPSFINNFPLPSRCKKGDVSELQAQSQVRKAVGSNEKNVAIKICNDKSENLRSCSK